MAKSLYKYKEATVSKQMLIIGMAMDIILIMMVFLLMRTPSLA